MARARHQARAQTFVRYFSTANTCARGRAVHARCDETRVSWCRVCVLHVSRRYDAGMHALSSFRVTEKWPPRYPDRLQLYSLPTPNGVKVSIMLEEIGLPYESHRVSFNKDDQKTPEFLSLNPNGKIPAILDPDGPDGKPLPLFESGRSCNISRTKPASFCRPIRRDDTRPSSGCISRWAGSDRCSG